MYTIDSLKINKFQEVAIPSPKELFERFGITNRKGSYTGDEKAPLPESKINTVAKVQKEAIAPEE